VTAKRSHPSESASAAASDATEDTDRPGCRVDPPYPGRSGITIHTPDDSMVATTSGRFHRVLGVPPNDITGTPPGAP
jgi:hypothetical protein